MATEKPLGAAAAMRARIVGWIIFLALMVVAYYGYAPPSIALFAAVILIFEYYGRFTEPPEPVVNPRHGIAVMGVMLVVLAAYFVMDGLRKTEFLAELESICSGVPEDNDARSEICEELGSQIESFREMPPMDDY